MSQPLKISLGKELMDLASVHPDLVDLTRIQIYRTLKVYTGMFRY